MPIDKHLQQNGLTKELCAFQHGIVIGCYLSNKSVRHIYALLELPWSTVSAHIVKSKHLGATTAQPRSGKIHKLTEWESRMLKSVARKHRLFSVATLPTKFQSASGSKVSTRTVRRTARWWSVNHHPREWASTAPESNGDKLYTTLADAWHFS